MAQKARVNSTLFNIMDTAEGENYYTDLELAAAIGKNLLERNKELELLLCSTQDYADEQEQKSQYLSRQLEDARELNESRVKLMEQIEKNHEQLSRSHAKLKRETRSIQEHNEVLSENLQSLIDKCDRYKNEMENLKRENSKLQRQVSETQIQTEPENEVRDEKTVENSAQDLSVVIEELKFEQDLEKCQREELENELEQLIVENQNLEQKLRLFAGGSRSCCEEERRRNETKTVNDEEQEVEIEESDCDLNDSFVLIESKDTEELDRVPSFENSDISFLDELDQQYRELVTKYNSLVEKCKSEGVPYESRVMCMVQRGVQTSEEKEVGIEGRGVACDTERRGIDCEIPKKRGQNSEEKSVKCVGRGVGSEAGAGASPQYKQMFAKLYEKIREGKK